ncbi:Dolichyl-phosphate-mannose-protein mannosyltransferase [Granulicella rosea]|uniref:Dolichyl-phosphate-mannose-protein mannosyltransferase n=1 Tax=Granulicella rosea TaxID=474952 RepID=A0A239EU24_9BACT|nr:glycosyltransferase family 39 protein [Granulicella rosea]SNS47392.1 Dolichyl-phosphate-mannose-protein mannosyltransferase [Granulicella rosea]
MVETMPARHSEMPNETAHEGAKFRLAAILSLALVLRLTLVGMQLRNTSAAAFFGMATDLGSLSRSVALGHGLSSPFGGSTGASAFLAPGYPVLIGTIFRIFGIDSRNAEIFVMLMQAAFCVAAIALLMLTARRLFDAATANLAGIVCAVSPPILWLPVLFWETSLSTLLLCAMLYLTLLAAAPRRNIAAWLGMGACAGIALLVNPSLLTLIACCFAWATYRTARISFAGPVAGALLCLLLFTPWPVRNLRTMHAFIPLRTNLGYELWQGNRPGADGFFEPNLHPSVDAVQFQEYSMLGEIGYMRRKSELSKAAIRAEPARFLRLTLKRFASFWTGIDKKTSYLLIVYICLTSLLGFSGLYLSRRRSGFTLLLAILALFPLPYYVTHPDGRFRLVLDPILTMLTAYAVTCWRRRTAKLASVTCE